MNQHHKTTLAALTALVVVFIAVAAYWNTLQVDMRGVPTIMLSYQQSEAATAPTLTASPMTVTLHQTSTLVWNTGSYSCIPLGGWSGSGTKDGSGATVVTPPAAGTEEYIFSCSGYGAIHVTITVNSAPPVGTAPTTGTLGATTPTELVNSTITFLKAQGYTVSDYTDNWEEVVGEGTKTGKPTVYFSLQDQVVSPPPPSNDIGQCSATDSSYPTSPIPLMVDTDGTIPHISTNFNVMVDPRVYQAANATFGYDADQFNTLAISNLEAGYSSYAAVPGLPQPTTSADPGALVVLYANNIPPVSYISIQNGQPATTYFKPAAQEATVSISSPWPVSSGFPISFLSSQTMIDALQSGETLVVVTVDISWLNSLKYGVADNSFSCVMQHEMGHALGLGDDYLNTNSPMHGGTCPGDLPSVPLTPLITSYLQAIQAKQSFTAASCPSLPLATTTVPQGPPPGWIDVGSSPTGGDTGESSVGCPAGWTLNTSTAMCEQSTSNLCGIAGYPACDTSSNDCEAYGLATAADGSCVAASGNGTASTLDCTNPDTDDVNSACAGDTIGGGSSDTGKIDNAGDETTPEPDSD